MTTLPLRHLSVRVPWHDTAWDGRVCTNPQGNAACLALDRIRESREDDDESAVAGRLLSELPESQWPACIAERGTLMAPFEIVRTVVQPYSPTSEAHKHILPTKLRLPPYSVAAIPFRWMNRQFAWQLAEEHGIDASPDREPTDPEWLRRNRWVQSPDNQKALLEGFFSAIQPERSLCFFYAKQTPLMEDERRVIVGVGRVKHVGPLVEYEYAEDRPIRSYIWDRVVQHSIEPEFRDGFLLPYHSILGKLQADSSLNPEDFVAFAPDDRQIEFSYAAEHVTHDAAIAGLLECKRVIENSMTLVEGPWERVLPWIDERLGELWKLRGPYPGLGAALSAFGVQLGSFLAYELAAQLQGDEDPWPLVDHVFRNPTALPASMQGQITSVLQAKWKNLHENKPERIELLKLLSRFELTAEQAKRWYDPERRADAGIDVTDHEILQNPYLIFERDRMAVDSVSVWTIDRGVLPGASVLRSHPLPSLSAMESSADVRRLRAVFVFLLYRAADRGHTLLPRAELIRQFRALNIDPPCDIDGDLLDAVQDQFAPDIHVCELKDGSAAYQLHELNKIGAFIRDIVERRINGTRHRSSVDWAQRLNEKLDDPATDELERKAREEKAAALKELAESRISVLVGPAGTGKTTLLSVLCNEPSIRNDGVLLLAPTGKARVRLQRSTGLHAQTLAQFLRQWGRYDENTGFYYMSGHKRYSGPKTVIIDEASMLTENQLAALLDALTGVQRLILVGDPRQLPPIGAGRPFVDIVNRLTPPDIATRQPKVGAGYAELTVRRRYGSETREDLQLAEWFSGRALGPGDDEIFNPALTRDGSSHLRFVTWRDEAELHEQLLTVLSEELKLRDRLDAVNFELSLGGTRHGGYVYFNRGAADYAEDWQILSPVRGMAHGVRELNRFIQHTYRRRMIDSAKLPSWQRKTPSPMGPEGIVYGDKVINVLNHSRNQVYPNTAEALKYVANGEIGIVVGQFKNRNMDTAPTKLQVEFSSQQGFVYNYTNRDFRDEGNPLLELAYAITVHKAQGSEFEICFLVLPQPCRTVTRELLYTALTRQQQKIVILIQGEPTDILKYSSDYFSDTARRLTNLFEKPMPTVIADVFLEENLIHKSGKGEPMRSKSEVIIADALASAGIQYHYEMPLRGTDGQIRYPDFTIQDDHKGITYYWEHCGMLYNPQYRERWERKLQWYRSQHILPIEEGGGGRGTLIVTRDDENGGISSHEIKQLIHDIWDIE